MTTPSNDFPTPLSKNGKTVGAVMVVGGGVAGMQASLDLAEAGFKVYLVERQPAIGGHMAALDKTFPTNDCAMCIVSPRLVTVAGHHNIQVLTNTELLKLDGWAGHFTATVHSAPRYIDLTKCTGCGDCASVCPITLPDHFNGDLNDRKAAFKLYPQAVPSAYAIEKIGIAPCRDACPAGQRVQGYIALIREERYDEALRIIKEENPFPGVCGRICNRRCETACNRGLVDEPISIAALKRFVVDQAYAQPYVAPPPATRKYDEQVAIIGAGPCGLTAAKDLALAGYGVTVFEALPVAGGMMRVGVPEYRMPTWIVNREVQEIVDLGVELRLNARVQALDDVFAEGFNAVLVAVGAHESRRLPIPGSDHPDTLVATDFLRDVRLDNGPDLQGRHVLVLGGGNVAMDCARTAVRLGAKQVDVTCLESRATMPADEHEIDMGGEEGITFYPSRSFVQILSEDGKLTGVKTVDVSYMEFAADGKLTAEFIPGSDKVLACDTVIFAIGQHADLSFIPQDSGIRIPRVGMVSVDPGTYATERSGVFAAGDVITGTTFVVDAIAAGHKVAESIHKFLCGETLVRQDHPKPPVATLTPNEIADRIERGEIERSPRRHMAVRGVDERSQSFEEVAFGFTPEEAQAEAERCLECGACSECLSCYFKCAAGAICPGDEAITRQINVGAVILAPGFDLYDGRRTGEYGLGRFPNVVTSMQYERILSPSGPYGGHLKRPSDGREPKRVAWIQCVGSRDTEHSWCSAVCCIYAAKQAIITMEHVPGTECTIFYIDFRAYSKGFDSYYEKAKESGVRYLRVIPSAIKQAPITKDLEIQYTLPDESIVTEIFDMVVLSVGMHPPEGIARLAGELGVELTPNGFVQTSEDAPLNTSREGVYVCGPIVEPKDIPETVISASAAAARAMTLLAEARHTLVTPKVYPPEADVSGQPPRVGVFVCNCGTNIAGVVDVEAVIEYARTLPNVIVADHNLFTCSSTTHAKIQEAIKEHDLNRIVVAACTPRTHETLFRSTIREAGLNFYLFEMANIRDQCSWVHRGSPEAATEKAKDLVRIAVAKVRLVEPLPQKSLEFNHDALVIGGGLAGMTTALELANQGFRVSLVERERELGGTLRHLHFLLDHSDPQRMLHNMAQRTLDHPNIKTFLNAEVAEFEGSMGNFKTTLRSSNGDNVPVINHGVAIVATGAEPLKTTEYLYGQDERILTQLEFEAMLGTQPAEAQKLRSVVMIQCVGSRTAERPYCSRVCCGTAVKNALELRRISPETDAYILYRDVRTYSVLEQYYQQAREAGVTFLRFEDDKPPKVTIDGSLQVTVHDALLNEDVILQADRLVLSVATVPRSDASDLAQLLKVPCGQDGFFQEAHMKLAPVDFATEGIFLCGMAHFPKRVVHESVTQAIAAAGRAATVLGKPVIEIEPTISHVVEEKCDGCAYCVDPCPFDAITLVEYEDDGGQVKKRVVVDEMLCKGCGTCQATCPKEAIFVWHFKPEQLRAMTMAALER